MCLHPRLIDNPNYGSRSPTIVALKDTLSHKIPVPCGYCPVCLQLRQSYFVQRVQCEAFEHDIFSCMLSYNNTYLPTVEINGYKHKYADPRDIQLFIKRIRNRNVFGCDFKFFAISEFGGKRHRPHWHLLFFLPKPDKPYTLFENWQREEDFKWLVLDEWYYNKGSKRRPIKDPMLTYFEKNGKRNYDFHFVNPLSSEGMELDIAFYTSKYLTKSSDYVKNLKSALYFNLSGDDYAYYWNLIRPRSLSSLHFGLGINPHTKVLDYLDNCIDFSLRNSFPSPVFINPVDGSTFPMSPYLLKARGLSFDEAIAFRKYADHLYVSGTNIRLADPLDPTEVKVIEDRFKRVQQKIQLRDIGDYLDTDSSVDNDLFFCPQHEEFSFDRDVFLDSCDF